MRYRLVPLVLLVAVLGACGKEIGDPCFNPIDCSPNGDRICVDAIDTAVQTVEGYCTVRGCDYSTCPDEAVCVRFFTGTFSNKACDPKCDLLYGRDPQCPAKPPIDDPATPADEGRVQCSFDEICQLEGHCVARSAEVRYCMRTCGSDDDCRDGYECRDLEKMVAHGGEPVLAPIVQSDGTQRPAPIDDDAPRFCAKAPG